MEKIKDNLGKIFIGICLIISFFFGKQCGNDNKHIIGTVSKTIVRHDTIWPDTMKIEIPKPYKVHDTTYIGVPYDIPVDSLKLKAFFKSRIYKNMYKDSNFEISVTDTIIGYKIGQGINYRQFKPLSIVNSTTTSINRVDTIRMSKRYELRVSIDATSKNLFGGLEYQKNRVTYGLAYDPFNKQTKVKMAYTIFSK